MNSPLPSLGLPVSPAESADDVQSIDTYTSWSRPDDGGPSNCSICNVKFQKRTFTRRHTCRVCGLCICAACSPSTLVDGQKDKGSSRMCKRCMLKSLRVPMVTSSLLLLGRRLHELIEEPGEHGVSQAPSLYSPRGSVSSSDSLDNDAVAYCEAAVLPLEKARDAHIDTKARLQETESALAQQQRLRERTEKSLAQEQQFRQGLEAALADEKRKMETLEAALADERQARQMSETALGAECEQRKTTEAALNMETQKRQAVEEQVRSVEAAHVVERQKREAVEAAHAAEQQKRETVEAAHAAEQQRREMAEAAHAAERQKRELVEVAHAEEQEKRETVEANHADERQKRQEAEAALADEQQKRKLVEVAHADVQQEREAVQAALTDEQRKRRAAEAAHAEERQKREAVEVAHAHVRRRREADEAAHAIERKNREEIQAAHGAERQKREAAELSLAAERTKLELAHAEEKQNREAVEAALAQERRNLQATESAYAAERRKTELAEAARSDHVQTRQAGQAALESERQATQMWQERACSAEAQAEIAVAQAAREQQAMQRFQETAQWLCGVDQYTLRGEAGMEPLEEARRKLLTVEVMGVQVCERLRATSGCGVEAPAPSTAEEALAWSQAVLAQLESVHQQTREAEARAAKEQAARAKAEAHTEDIRNACVQLAMRLQTVSDVQVMSATRSSSCNDALDFCNAVLSRLEVERESGQPRTSGRTDVIQAKTGAQADVAAVPASPEGSQKDLQHKSLSSTAASAEESEGLLYVPTRSPSPSDGETDPPPLFAEPPFREASTARTSRAAACVRPCVVS